MRPNRADAASRALVCTFIEEFSFDVQHRVGRKHQNVDSLSRMPIRDEGTLLETEPRELRISAATQQGDVDEPAGDVLAGENFAAEQLSDPEIGPVLQLRLSCEAQPPIEALTSELEATKVYWSQWDQLTVHNGVLCRRFYGKGSQSNVLQMIVPATPRSEVMRRCHSGIVGGHLGAKKTAYQVGRRFYWHHWQSDVKRFCQRCVVCGSYHRGKLPRTAPLQPIEAGAPFERLSIDLTGPHCKSTRGNVWILTCLDPYSKWAEAIPLRNKEAETVARVLVEQVLMRFGTPIAMLSDRGNEVDSSIMRDVCRLLDIDKMRTTSYRPSTNGAVERFHRTLNSMLGKVVAENQKDWDTKLPFVMAAYRASQHESTGYSPNYLVFGRELRAPLDVVLDLPKTRDEAMSYDGYVSELDEKLRYAYRAVKAHLGRAANRAKRHYDLRVKRSRYEIGDWVSYYNPRHFRGREDQWSRKFSGPFLVMDVLPPVNLKLQRSPSGKPFIAHYDRVKLWEGKVPKSWLRNVPKHEEFDMLSPVSATEVDAPVAVKPLEGSPVTADATSSDTELKVCDEAGFVADNEARNVTEYVAEAEACNEAGAEASEAHFIDSRPKRARRRPAYLADYTSAVV